MMIYYGFVSYLIIEFLKNKSKRLICLIIVMLYVVYPTMSYFRESSITGNRRIDQYYPWHSVFTKQVENDRELLFNKYNVY